MKTVTPFRTRILAAVLLVPIILIAGCQGLGQGTQDIGALRSMAQGRFDKLTAVSMVLDRLAAQPSPQGMSVEEKKGWDNQTRWLLATSARLTGFAGSLRTVLNSPMPSGGMNLDNALQTAQLAGDYIKLNNEFQGLLTLIYEEAKLYGNTNPKITIDSTKADKDKNVAFFSPMKTRHDSAVEALGTLA